MRWKTNGSTVFNIKYHLIWCPKFRRPVLIDEVEARLRDLLYKRASELESEIENLQVMPDHVHAFVATPPTLAPHYVVSQLKGYSSRILRLEFPELKSRLPCLWTRSYYCESVGHISEEVVKKYIQDQKNR